jgi:hypothetical protein
MHLNVEGNIMSRPLNSYSKFAQFIGNYFYYRRQGFRLKESWRLASLTLPI